MENLSDIEIEEEIKKLEEEKNNINNKIILLLREKEKRVSSRLFKIYEKIKLNLLPKFKLEASVFQNVRSDEFYIEIFNKHAKIKIDENLNVNIKENQYFTVFEIADIKEIINEIIQNEK